MPDNKSDRYMPEHELLSNKYAERQHTERNEIDVLRATDGKPLKQTEAWGKADDEVFERYYKQQEQENRPALNNKACLGCEW